MPCGMVALEGVAESLVALSLPDGRDRFLEDVAEHTLFPIFSSTPMSEGGEAAGENITTRSDIGQRIRTSASRPRACAEIADQALHGSRGPRGAKGDPTLLAHALTLLH